MQGQHLIQETPGDIQADLKKNNKKSSKDSENHNTTTTGFVDSTEDLERSDG